MHTNIRRIREEQFLGVPLVAKLVGVTSEEYKAIEEARFDDIDNSILNRLSKLFGVAISDIQVTNVTLKTSNHRLSENDNAQLQKLYYYREQDKIVND